MTPKEKAIELVDKYNELLGQHIFNGHFDISQQCALIAVDEIDYSQPYNLYDNEDKKQYWLAVKQEIESL